ncbi:hypothetical protein [Candidatus Bathycorpusculum sp.]|uniref:hypothetical protein n=1 Tax=Candidatus Bathycorpusculum sp. TaxID=2994959 RepID=UPI002820BA87|nr:hypothetical protein [Candidatus Termitimicrobium sp.]
MSKASDNTANQPPDTLEGEIVTALNSGGYLFQKYCARKIQESGWTIDTEEYPISDNLSIDLKVTKFTNDTAREIAIVEVKRQDPQRKRWIFFKDENPKFSSFSFQGHCLNTPAMGRSRKGTYVARSVRECLNEEDLEMPQCHSAGIEFFKESATKSCWKSNSEIIYKSCFNVAHGVNHLFDVEAEALQRTIRYGINRLENEKKIFGRKYWFGGTIIPVVITSAPLMSVSFDPELMDTSTFKVKFDNIVHKKQKWLVYDFPLPKSLQYNPVDIRQMFAEDRYAKMHIFIVNGNYVGEFFNKLALSIKGCFKKNGFIEMSYTDFYKPNRKRFFNR